MIILSISFGYNGCMSLLSNGKIIKNTALSKLNNNENRELITPQTFAKFFRGTNITIDDINYFVFSGFNRDLFDFTDVDFIPDDEFLFSVDVTYENENLKRKPIKYLPTLYPPYTKHIYDYVSGHFIFKKFVKQAFIVSPDLSYTSFGYFASNFSKSVNITINSNDGCPYDGSMVSVSKNNNISVVERPKISVGKLYPKMTELLGFGLGVDNKTTICDISTRYNIPSEYEDIIDSGENNMYSNLKDNYELNFFFKFSTTPYYQDMGKNKMIPYSSFNGDDLNSKYVTKTASMTQRVVENTIINLIRESIDKYSGSFTNNLTLSGDIFENRRLNTKILKTFPDVNIYISPITSEESMSLGAALYINAMYGFRRVYDRDFLLSTSPYQIKFDNNGDSIDYRELSKILDYEMVSFNYKDPEYGQKSLGYTGILFGVDNPKIKDNNSLMVSNPYQKHSIMIMEEEFDNYFISSPYTYDNNTIAKPILPHLFKNFIHDDGSLNVFVINPKYHPSLYNILKETDKKYLGLSNFTTINKRHIFKLQTIFEITQELGIKHMIIDGKIHIK